MKKTSIYLTQEEVDGLRNLATATGKSQAELIRAGIRRILTGEEIVPRRFHSLGKGHGDGTPYAPWDPDDLYKSVMGEP
jgi:Arc/MetJ-type ribon-helix-helix transcriptional regulator